MNENETFSSSELERKIITLDDIIDPNRTVSEEYQKLIRAQEEGTGKEPRLTSPFTDAWLNRESPQAEEMRQCFRERLKDNPLIDLGSGQSSMRRFALEGGASTYICVDRYIQNPDLAPDPFRPIQEKKLTWELTEIVVKADMLDFISRVKDCSANFTLNGIDPIIINDKEYHAALARELLRTTRPKGVIFGSGSYALHLLDTWIKEGKIPLIKYKVDLPGLTYIFEKE